MVSTTDVTDQQIDDFLTLYDGDVIKAVHGLRDYALTHRQPTRRPKVSKPVGDVLIQADNLQKQYKIGRQKINALNGVSLKIHVGEFVALTGASGSGKSTLLQLLGGLDKPTAGTLLVDGVNPAKLRDGKLSTFRAQTIGFVFQFFYLQPFLKIGTNLEVPAMFAGMKRSARQKRVKLLTQQVGLSDRVTHLPRELSGGQMQRAAIARALFNNPKVILADEPTGNLDSKNGKAIIDLFEQIREEFGTTIIVVTHDQAVARRADREIVLRDGVIV